FVQPLCATPLILDPLPLAHLFFLLQPPPLQIYPLALHAALPISLRPALARLRRAAQPRVHLRGRLGRGRGGPVGPTDLGPARGLDRKSTRLNSSHVKISYAVFCLKKKKVEASHHSGTQHYVWGCS